MAVTRNGAIWSPTAWVSAARRRLLRMRHFRAVARRSSNAATCPSLCCRSPLHQRPRRRLRKSFRETPGALWPFASHGIPYHVGGGITLNIWARKPIEELCADAAVGNEVVTAL